MATSPDKHWKYQQVYEHMHAAIVEGKHAPGARLPTDGQLMRKFRASRPTVARAMRDLEIAGLLERRPGSGSFVRVSAAPKTKPLGLLIPCLVEMGIMAPICGEIARTVQRHHFHLRLAETTAQDIRGRLEQTQRLCRQFVDEKLMGVFFAPMELVPEMEHLNRQIAEALDRAGIVVVLLDGDLEKYPKRSKYDLIGVDNCRIGYMQTEYLLGLGCRHIEHLAVPLSAPTVEARTEGYRQALRHHRVRFKEAWVRRGDPSDLEFVRSLTRKMPDAFVCANDRIAALLMRSLQALGVCVPKDVRVVGVDDVEYAPLLSPPLTTIRQPCREIGAAAVNAMISRIENRTMPARNIMLDGQLVVRESCGGRA